MDSRSDIAHSGNQPARRPPNDEPERVGEGELDIGPPADLAGVDDQAEAPENHSVHPPSLLRDKDRRGLAGPSSPRNDASDDVVSD